MFISACAGENTDSTVNTDDVAVNGQETVGASHDHTFSEKTVIASTCSVAGKKAMQCSCGEIQEGSEKLLPLTAHNAKEATCTEDSVCADCGKVLVLKYDHFFIDTVVTEAGCNSDGLSRSACHRCGLSSDTVIPKQHDLDDSKLIVSGGNVGSKCLKCGEVSGYTEQEPLILLQFEDSGEAAKYPDFTFTYPTTSEGAAYPGKAIWMGYNVDKIKALPQYMITFDFKLNSSGLVDKGESVFTLIGGVTYKSEKPGTKQDWVWAFKYFESAGVVSTVMQGFNDSNSIKVEKGKWHNFVGIVDNTTREIKVYINGTYIGARAVHDYNNADFGGAFCMRFYDAVPVNGTSDPMFDNFKIAEIK